MDEEQEPLPSDEEPHAEEKLSLTTGDALTLAKLTSPAVKWASVFWDYTKRALPDPYRWAQVASYFRSLGRSLTYEDEDILDPQTVEFLKSAPQGTWPQNVRRGEDDVPLAEEDREQLLLSIPEDWRHKFTSFDRRWQFRSMLQSLQDEEQWQRKVQAAPLSESIIGSLWQGFLELAALNKVSGGASLVKNLRPLGWIARAAKTTASGAEIGAKLAAWESLLRPSSYPTEQLPSRALDLAEKFGTFHLAAFFLAPITRPFIRAAKRSRLFNLWLWEHGKPAGFRYGSEPKEFSVLRAQGKVREVIPLDEAMQVELIPEEYEARAVSPQGKYRYVQKFRGKGQAPEASPGQQPPPHAPENPHEIWESLDSRAQELMALDTDHADRLSKLLRLYDEAQSVPEALLGEFLNPSEAAPALACAVLAEDYAADLQNDFPSYRFEVRKAPAPGKADLKTGGRAPEPEEEALEPRAPEPEPKPEPEAQGVVVTEYRVLAGNELRRELPKSQLLSKMATNPIIRSLLQSPQSICMQSDFLIARQVGARSFYNNFLSNKELTISQVPPIESLKDEAMRLVYSYASFSDQCLKDSGLSIDDYETELYYASTHGDKAQEGLEPSAAVAAVERDAMRQRAIMDELLSEAQKNGQIGFVLNPVGFSYRSHLYVRDKVNKNVSEFDKSIRSYLLEKGVPRSVIPRLVAIIHLRIGGYSSEAKSLTEPSVYFNVDSYVERIAPNLKRRVIDVDPMILKDYQETNPVRFISSKLIQGKTLSASAKMRNDLESEHMIKRWKDRLSALQNKRYQPRWKQKTRDLAILYVQKVIDLLERTDLGEIKSERLARNSIERWKRRPVKNLTKRLRPQDLARFKELQARYAQNDWTFDVWQQSPRAKKKAVKSFLSEKEKEFLSSLADPKPISLPNDSLQEKLEREVAATKAMDQEVEELWRISSESIPDDRWTFDEDDLSDLSETESAERVRWISRAKGASVFSTPPPKNLSSAEIDSLFPTYGNQLKGFLWFKELQELSDSIEKEHGLNLMSLIGLPRLMNLSDILYNEYSSRREELSLAGAKELTQNKQAREIDSLMNSLDKEYESTKLVFNHLDDFFLGSWGAPTSQGGEIVDKAVNALRAFTMATKLGHSMVSVFAEAHNSTARFGLVPWAVSAVQRVWDRLSFVESDWKDEIAFLRSVDGMGLAMESAQLKIERYFGNLQYFWNRKEYKEFFSYLGGYIYQSTGLPFLSDLARETAWPLLEAEWERAFRENDTRYLRRNGVDPHWEKILRSQVEKFATKGRLNFRLWEDPQSVLRFRDLLRVQQNTLVMMPSLGATPLILNGTTAKLFMQFKRIILSGHRMILMPKLAEGDYSGLIRLVIHGVLWVSFVYFLKWLTTGAYKREKFLSYRTCKTIASKIDSLSFLVEAWEAVEALSVRGDFRDMVSIPSAGSVKDLFSSGKMLFTRPKEIFSSKGMRSIKKLTPVANNILLEPLWVALGAYSDQEEKYVRAKQKESIARDYDARVKKLQRHISRPIPLYHEVEEQKKKLRRQKALQKKPLHRR